MVGIGFLFVAAASRMNNADSVLHTFSEYSDQIDNRRSRGSSQKVPDSELVSDSSISFSFQSLALDRSSTRSQTCSRASDSSKVGTATRLVVNVRC